MSALSAVGVSLAYDPIRVWYAEPNDPSAVSVDQYAKRVTIYKPVTIKVEAVNEDGTLADIDHITVDPNCVAGAVNVLRLPQSGRSGRRSEPTRSACPEGNEPHYRQPQTSSAISRRFARPATLGVDAETKAAALVGNLIVGESGSGDGGHCD